jgi:hypothetical protein
VVDYIGRLWWPTPPATSDLSPRYARISHRTVQSRPTQPNRVPGHLLDDELERLEQICRSRRVTEPGVDPNKTLTSFDFAAVPDLDRGRVADLATPCVRTKC